MDLLKIIGIGLIAVISITILKPLRPEFTLIIGMGASILILLLVADEIFEVIYSFYQIAETTSIDKGIFSKVLKIIGIGYLSEFGNSICIDADCKGIGDKIIFAGKIAIMILALPIIKNLITIIIEILP